MKHLLLLLALVMLCVGPVVGLSLDFQNVEDYGEITSATCTRSYAPAVSGDGVNNYLTCTCGPFCAAGFTTVDSSITTYAAFTIPYGAYNPTVYFLNPTGVVLGSVAEVGANPPAPSRYEVLISGNVATLYVNGIANATSGALATNPSFLRIYGSDGLRVDDLITSSLDPRYILGSPERGYYLKKDMTNPAASGLYSPTGGVISSSNITATWGKSNITYSGNESVVFMNKDTGGIYFTSYTGGNAAGVVSVALSDQLFNAGAPYGVYAFTIPASGAYSDDVWYIGSGAAIAFDRDTYSTGDTATITYSVSSGGYWDTAVYDYKIDVQDIYGTVIDSQLINTQTGSVTVTFSTDDSLGVYYAILKATPKAGGDAIWMNYDYAGLQAYITFSGYVMDAETGAVLPNAYVNVTQGTATKGSLSMNPSGAWNSTNNWLSGSAFNITTNKTGFTSDVRLFTPLTAKSIFLNISLVPLPPANISVSVGGIVRDNVYGNPIRSATVSGVNNTATATNFTNIAGYYRVDNMFNPDVVNMSAAKTGYVNDTVSGFEDAVITSSFTRRDLILDPVFSLTVNIIDSSTHMPIPVVLVTDSLGNNQTTTTGTFIESYPYSAVILYITSTGYTGRAVSYIIDSDRTETVELSEAVEALAAQPQSYPKYVTFHIKDGSMFGAPLAEVGINVTGISTSSGDWDWVSQLLGVPLNEVPINTAHMYQSTDSLGRATFYVIPTAKYNITFTKAGYTIPPMILVPQDDDYIVTATSATSPFYRNGVDELSAINISVSSTLYNESWAFLNFTYYDSTGHTTGGTVRVLQKSDTAWVADSVMATWPVTSSSFSNSTVVVHVQQVSGYIDANITHSDFGRVVRSYPYSFNSVPVQFLGFEQDITLMVALGIMLFTMMLGGAAHGRILLVVVSIEGWVMYTFHWFQSLFDRGVPETAFITTIVLMFVIGILANILMRKKRGL